MEFIKSISIKKFVCVFSTLFTGLTLGSFLLVGCSTAPDVGQLKQILEENPDILANAIKKNPKPIMAAINDAAQEARREQVENAQKAQEEARIDARKNPRNPQIDDDRVIFGQNKKDAKITIVEYSDFQCGYCGRAYNTMKQILDKYKDKVRVVYKHLPLDFHPLATPAARYYEAIALQDHKKATQFHDKIFENQGSLTSDGEKFLERTAKEVKANMAKLKKDLESDKVKNRVQADKEEATKFGFNGTPGFLVNGVPLNGAQPMDAFENEFRKQGLLD